MALSPESPVAPVELANTVPQWDLNQEDLNWIQEYLPQSGAATAAFDDLNRLGMIGSTHNGTLRDHDIQQGVRAAREDFLLKLGIPPRTLAVAQSRSNRPQSFLIPTSSFVAAQRVLHAHGVSGGQLRRAYRFNPSLLAYSANNWKKRYEHLDQFFTDEYDSISSDGISSREMMGKIISRAPRALNESAESLSQRMSYLTGQGVSMKTIGQQPAIPTLNAASLKKKMDLLTTVSDDPWNILNRAPSIASLSAESITSRIANLDQLGLDSKAVVSRFPKILTSAESSIRTKAAYIKRTAQVLGWTGDTNDLLTAYPAILSSAQPRLRLLARILATGAHVSRQQAPHTSLTPALITPIESYIIAFNDSRYDSNKASSDIVMLARAATRATSKTTDSPSRVQLAQEALPNLKAKGAGTIALMYENYVSKDK